MQFWAKVGDIANFILPSKSLLRRTAGHSLVTPKEIGIYHVIAIATGNGGKPAQVVAKVTAGTHYDTPPAP